MATTKENQSVRNACALVEAIAAGQPIGVSDLARRTGVQKSAAQRIVVTLHRAGWLQQTDDARWRLAAALAVTLAAASSATLRDLARTTLHHLCDTTGETAMLVALERGRLRVLDVVDSAHALRMSAPVGADLPIPHSAALRAIAAHASDLDEDTLAETRHRGWSVNDRAVSPEARVVGAAVLGPDLRPLAALLVCAPASRVDLDAMHDIGRRVAHAATRLAESLAASTPAMHLHA
jgi:DNA-binding IclR family transcriptional regulator